jgi:hypothetical protein
VFASNLLVTQSNLQAAFVGQAGKLVAWVTSSQGASKPVAGAKVQVYLSKYNEVSRRVLLQWPAGKKVKTHAWCLDRFTCSLLHTA